VPTIAVEVLQKSYGAVRAVDGLSFTVEAGEVFALLGPNGAGKTTTVEILTGHRRRSGGGVDVLGFDPATGGRAYLERIGVVLQSAGFEEEFTVRELVRLQSRLYPRVHQPDEVIELVGLTDKRNARVKTLSGGQRRRLDLALGLVGAPDLLFLDEPTTGFDPSARHHAWDLVERLRDTGTTILLTTHYMDEAQALANRVAVIAAGRIVAEGAPATLAGRDAVLPVITYRLPPDVSPPAGLGDRAEDGSTLRLVPDDLTAALHRLTGWAIDAGVELADLRIVRPSLEDVYLHLTGPQS